MGSAVGYFVIGFANTLLLVFVGRIVGGITGANISTAQAYIADVTSKENRAKGMGLFGAAFGFGFVFGPALSGILSKYGPHVPFFFAAGLSFANAAALYFLLPESLSLEARAHVPERKSRLADLLESFGHKTFREINIVYFLLVTSFSIMTYGFVLYTAYRFHFTPEQNGYLFALIGIIAIIAQGLIFTKLANSLGESVLVVAGCLMMVVSLFAVPIVGPGYGGLTVLLIGTALLALGNSLASPGLTSLASKTASEKDQGRTLGIMQSGASLARVIGPLLGGILLNNKMDLIDDSTIYRTFWTASAIMFVAFLVAIYFARTTRIKTAAA
ncbi:MAG: MFS transporter [Pyrinomonadaceae bacterium]